jgi:hypothetical protein
MREVIYTMHFRGQASRSGGDTTVLKATSSGTSCNMETVVRADGVSTTVHAVAGDLAFLECELRLTPPDRFDGTGTLSFGEASEHALRFTTVGGGHMERSAERGRMAGSASWRVEGGEGQFESATGFIASTFTIGDDGDLSEYHCGMIFMPE